MKFTVCYQGRHGDTEMHRAGCRDIARTVTMTGTATQDFEAESCADAVAAVVADLNASFGWPESYPEGESAPWSVHDIGVLPCARK